MKSFCIVPLLFFTLTNAQYWALDPSKEHTCPPVTEKPTSECQTARSTCWSPGVRDTDCPANGLCCFDGCAATCLGVSAPVAVIPLPKPAKKKPVHIKHPKQEYAKPVYPKKEHKKPVHPKHEYKAPVQPSQSPRQPKMFRTNYPVHPSLGRVSTQCPQVAARNAYECANARPNCWSRGVPDTDCPGHGLCCFDGCVNTCLGQARYNPPTKHVVRVEYPTDPCSPSPCGPGTTCTVNTDDNPVCQCQPGLVPKPDTIRGCGPECVIDPDCSYGLICRNQRCVERPDPCNPSPCGPGTTCVEDRHGNPVCHCEPGLVPKPDTITGCGHECKVDPDCQHGFKCENYKCVVHDPCNPSPCGPRTTCRTNSRNDPVCDCLPGFVPKPDTITGCGYECTVDRDCRQGYMCENYKCVEKEDPCRKGPCGPGTTCRVGSYHNAICECLPGLIPQPDTVTGCGPECEQDYDCGKGFICRNQKCIDKPDPCVPSPCGPGAICMKDRYGNGICECEPGLVPQPDTITGCGPECVVDPDCDYGHICVNQRCVEEPDPCNPSPCGPGTTCKVNKFRSPICRCLPRLFPKPDTITGCGPECEYDRDCNHGFECISQQCVEKKDPCNPNPCGMMAICTPRGYDSDSYDCKCPQGTFGDAYAGCQQGECLEDNDCSYDKACMDYFCINPCLTNSTCRAQDFCQVRNHIPVCGINNDEPPRVRTPIVIGERYDLNRQTSGSSDAHIISSRRRTSPRRLNKHVIGATYRRRRRDTLASINKQT